MEDVGSSCGPARRSVNVCPGVFSHSAGSTSVFEIEERPGHLCLSFSWNADTFLKAPSRCLLGKGGWELGGRNISDFSSRFSNVLELCKILFRILSTRFVFVYYFLILISNFVGFFFLIFFLISLTSILFYSGIFVFVFFFEPILPVLFANSFISAFIFINSLLLLFVFILLLLF